MTISRKLKRSFIAGEVGADLRMHFGDRGLAEHSVQRLRNFFVRPTGVAQRLPGLGLIREVKDSTKRTRVIKFAFSADQSYAIEVGAGYFRFHSNDGSSMFGGTVLYTTPADYIAPSTISAVGVNEITFTAAHNLSENDQINFTTSAGTLPGGIVQGVVYFAHITAPNKITVRASAGGADLTLVPAAFVPVVNCARTYSPGDLARFLGQNHYCFRSTVTVGVASPAPSDTAFWSLLPSAPNIYEIPNDYTEDELFAITYTRSEDVLTLACLGHRPRELQRFAHTRWVFATPALGAPGLLPPSIVSTSAFPGKVMDIITAPLTGVPAAAIVFTTREPHFLSEGFDVFLGPGSAGSSTFLPHGDYTINTAPAADTFTLRRLSTGERIRESDATGVYTGNQLAVSINDPGNSLQNTYVATSVGADNLESDPSAPVTVTNNLFNAGATNTLVLSDAAGAVRHRVYRLLNGLYGFIGDIDADVTNTFVDDNFAPDLGISPPRRDPDIATADPAAVVHFDGRRLFAGSVGFPQDVWGSRAGTESDFSFTLPLQSSDRLRFRAAVHEFAPIRHMVPLQHLLLLTASTEIRVSPVQSDALVATETPLVRPQSYVGANGVQPLLIGSTVLFAAARGGHVRELSFASSADGFVVGDLSLRAAHLFDAADIVDSAFAAAPYPLAVFASSTGNAPGITYIPAEGVGAWCVRETDGVIESVCAVQEGDEDRLYFVVRRTINGATKRFIEESAPMLVFSAADGFFVDCGVAYDGGPPVSTVSVPHLIGATVVGIADGAKITPQVVPASGLVTLPAAATKVRVGLRQTAFIELPPLALSTDGAAALGRPKNVNRVFVHVADSAPFRIGPSASRLVTALRAVDGNFQTTDFDTTLLPGWNEGVPLRIEQSDPLPLTLIGLTLEVAVGGGA